MRVEGVLVACCVPKRHSTHAVLTRYLHAHRHRHLNLNSFFQHSFFLASERTPIYEFSKIDNYYNLEYKPTSYLIVFSISARIVLFF